MSKPIDINHSIITLRQVTAKKETFYFETFIFATILVFICLRQMRKRLVILWPTVLVSSCFSLLFFTMVIQALYPDNRFFYQGNFSPELYSLTLLSQTIISTNEWINVLTKNDRMIIPILNVVDTEFHFLFLLEFFAWIWIPLVKAWAIEKCSKVYGSR